MTPKLISPRCVERIALSTDIFAITGRYALGTFFERVLAWGDPGETLRAVLIALADGPAPAPPELISILAGEDAPLELSAVEGLVNGGIELELRHGGQPAYWWLLAAE